MYLEQTRPTFLGILPKGTEGTRATLRIMRGIVRVYKKHPRVRDTAAELVSDLLPKNWLAEVQRIFTYVRDRVRYLKDVRGVETVQTPDATIDKGQGDCDDKAVLLASLLEAIGHPTRFVAVGYKPDRFSHVYVETLVGSRWIALDATEPYAAGWAPPKPASILKLMN